MKLCTYDMLFIIIFILFIIIFYQNFRKNENFADTYSGISTQGYQADIEAVRNLSNIARELTTNNSLTVPGDLKVISSLTVSGDINVFNALTVSGDMNVGKALTVNDIAKVKAVYCTGGLGGIGGTYFPFSDNKNYISGETIINGITTINGTSTNINSSDGVNIKNKLSVGNTTISGQLMINNIPYEDNITHGTITYNGVDNAHEYKQVLLLTTILTSSPYIIINKSTIQFKYACVYNINVLFAISGYFRGSGQQQDSNFMFVDASTLNIATPSMPASIIFNKMLSYSSERGTNMTNMTNNIFYGKASNNLNAYDNTNTYQLIFKPDITKQYTFILKNGKITNGTFIISMM